MQSKTTSKLMIQKRPDNKQKQKQKNSLKEKNKQNKKKKQEQNTRMRNREGGRKNITRETPRTRK